MDTQEIIKIIDFWQKAAQKKELRPREIIKTIDYRSKEIVDLVGVRRSGKSSILNLIIKKLNLNGDFLFLNFEDPFFINNNNPEVIEEAIEIFKEYFSPKLKYLFFDEIQEIDRWEKAVRKLRDGTDYKIFLTGSSSKLLSGEIASLLTGRHLSYRVFPLSFKEFLQFKKIDLSDKKDLILKEKIIFKNFNSYLLTGGFPEMVLSQDKKILKDYFLDILQKDIVMRHNIREKELLEKIAVYLFSNLSKTVSIESIKDTFNVSFALASSYFEYLKESFLVFELPLFAYSLKKQSKALKKIYAIDTGLANIVSFRFSEDKGRMMENIVFLHLKRNWPEIYYYKTKNSLEVDFLVKEKTKPKELMQVCWSLKDSKTKEREVNSLITALKELGLKKGLILTMDEKEDIKISNKIISVKPIYKWLLEDH